MTVEISPATSLEIRRIVEPTTKSFSKCLDMSDFIWVGKIDGEVACIWGIVLPSFLSDQAYLWLHTTEAVDEHQFLVVRYSQRMIEEIHKKYPEIVGHCDVLAERSIRWVKWLGGVFGQPEGRRIPFCIRRKDG